MMQVKKVKTCLLRMFDPEPLVSIYLFFFYLSLFFILFPCCRLVWKGCRAREYDQQCVVFAA